VFAADDLKAGTGSFKVMLTDKTSADDVDSGEHVQLEQQTAADAEKDAATTTAPDAADDSSPPAGDGGKKAVAPPKKPAK